MLTALTDRLPGALADLDPGNRALLDLSLRRGVSDREIGELLRKEPADVARGRDAVLELLADALDVDGPDRRDRIRHAVASLPDEAWRPRAAPAPPAPPPAPPAAAPPPERPPRPLERDREEPEDAVRDEVEPEREPEPRREPQPARERRRSRRGGLLAALGLLAVLGAVLALVLAGGDDDDEQGAPDRGSEPAPTPAPDQGGDGGQPGGRAERLEAVGGTRGSGRLTITDEGATIAVRGLPNPDGVYQVWLYDSIVRAESLGTVEGRSGRLEVSLPADAGSYRFLDISREPADGNPNHSGESVLRAPLGELLGE